MSKIKIGLELVPKSCWGTNLRSLLTSSEWKQISKHVRDRSKDTCHYCNTHSKKTHAHEVWSYDDSNCIQTLEDIHCVCEKCHLVKHFGYAKVQRRDKEAIEQLKVLNNCTDEEAMDHIADSFELWADRSSKSWKLDISKLNLILYMANIDTV